jgi:hypothetical protein
MNVVCDTCTPCIKTEIKGRNTLHCYICASCALPKRNRVSKTNRTPGTYSDLKGLFKHYENQHTCDLYNKKFTHSKGFCCPYTKTCGFIFLTMVEWFEHVALNHTHLLGPVFANQLQYTWPVNIDAPE